MERLFDRDKPHFAAWVWVYNIDDPFGLHMYHPHPEKPDANTLYYSALCGLYDMTERLIISYPQDVNSRGGQRTTPLHAALGKERLEVAQLLFEHGADVDSKDDGDRAPLHITSQCENVRIIQSGWGP
jgi:ankyrin repeat protein